MEECPICHKEYDPEVNPDCPDCVPVPPPLPDEDQSSDDAPPPPPELAPEIQQQPAPVRRADPDTKYIRRANASSRVDRPQMDRFVGGLVDQDLGFPVFSVCDCNSFHTSGYLWGLYALKSLVKKGKDPGAVAVVNFDQHADLGSANYHDVRSDGWGASMLNRLKSADFGGCYLSVGVGADDGGLTVSPRCDAEGCARRSADDKEAFVKLWSRMMQTLEKPIRYLFVSIDRDCLHNSYTQWGSGHFEDTAALTAVMGKVLQALFEVCESMEPHRLPELIGFDITGLPEHRMLLSDAAETPAKVWRDLDKQLIEIKSWISTFVSEYKRQAAVKRLGLKPGQKQAFVVPTPVKPQSINWSKVIFFSGSPGFACDEQLQEFSWDYAQTEWRYPDYAWWIGRNLRRLLMGAWQYVLTIQQAPVFMNGWKEFELFKPNRSLVTILDQKLKEYKKNPRNPMVAPPEDCCRLATEALGARKTQLGGFACTASLKDPKRVSYIDRPEIKRNCPEFVIFDPALNERGEYKPA